MKIAIVSPFIASSADNSFYASQHLYIASGLAKRGAEVEIFTMNRTGNGTRTESMNSDGGSIPIHYLPQASSLLTPSNLAMMKGLGRMLRKGQFDIVQISEDTQPTSIQVSLLHAGRHLTIFQGINEYNRDPLKRLLMRLFDHSLGTILKSRVSLVIAKTQQAADFISKKGYKNVFTIPMGVDTKLFFPQDKKSA